MGAWVGPAVDPLDGPPSGGLRRMILITGATGFIGGHLARLLSAHAEPLRVLVRETSSRRNLAGLDAEIALGDLRDPASLERAVSGCRRVFHAAADYRLWARNPRELYDSNVVGTRNLLQAAADAGAEQVVYTSTVGTIGEAGDEDSPASIRDMAGHYKRSKLEAEQVALEFAAKGLPVVVVNPTAPVGEADVKPTPTGQMIVDFLNGRMPAYLDTGLNLVDVRDVARGHLLAAERGRAGERYLLGARNMSLREIFEALARISGRPAPAVRLPYFAAWGFAAAETALSRVTGRAPRASLEAVRMARKKMYIHSDKARRELGFEPGPVEDALERAAAWFQANRYC